MYITRESVFGAIVSTRVVLRLPLEVTLKYMALAGSVDPSATVVVASASDEKAACVPKPSASPMNSRFELVVVPQVPAPSPVASSVRRRLLT